MDGIPVLEIDCNMEFHDDEAMKKKMLDQVIIYLISSQHTYKEYLVGEPS